MSQDNTALINLLSQLGDASAGDKITLNAIIEALGSRSFGLLFILLALLTLLPTGLITGVPIIVAIVMCLTAGQMFRGEDVASLPSVIGKLSFNRKAIRNVIDKYEPYSEKIEKYIHPRMPELFTPEVSRIIAGVAMFFAISLLPLMFISWAVMIPSAALIVMGAGIMVRDGVVVLASVAVMFTLLVFLPLFLA